MNKPGLHLAYTTHRKMHGLLALALLLLLPFPMTMAQGENNLQEIIVQPGSDLGSGFISEIDIVFVYDSSVLNQLPFTQFDWVSGKEEYLDGEDGLLDLVQIQVTAESAPQSVLLPARHKEAVGIMVYASHEDPVADALDISNETRILLQMESYGINVVQNPVLNQ